MKAIVYLRFRDAVLRSIATISWLIVTVSMAPALEIKIFTGPEGSIEHERIGPKIAEVVRPVAERHLFDIHNIHVLKSSGTRQTVERCGSETRTLCLGLARAGIPIDLPEQRRPIILAC